MTDDKPKAARKPRASTAKAEPQVDEAYRPATRSVTLAYTLIHEGTEHAPDTTVELPVAVARNLVRAGRARPAEEE